MNELIEIIDRRIMLLKKAIKKAELEKETFPEGRLRVSHGEGEKYRFYRVVDSCDSTGEYLTKENGDAVRSLAQKDYNKLFLKEAIEEEKRLRRINDYLKKKNANSIYEKLTPARKDKVDPYIIPDYIYAAEWEAKPYKTNTYMPERKIYDTKKGDKVRSKSEAMLADMFFDLGIPYHYEQALNLKYGGVRYPDFTLLKVGTREEIYFEHFGLLDDEEYRNGSLQKLDEYRTNGIYPGKNLLFTYETVENPLDIKGIRKMIKEMFS